MTRLRTRPQKNRVRLAAEPRDFLSLQTSKPTLRSTQWLPGDFFFVRRSGPDADQSPAYKVEVNDAWSCVSIPTHAFMERRLMTQEGNLYIHVS